MRLCSAECGDIKFKRERCLASSLLNIPVDMRAWGVIRHWDVCYSDMFECRITRQNLTVLDWHLAKSTEIKKNVILVSIKYVAIRVEIEKYLQNVCFLQSLVGLTLPLDEKLNSIGVFRFSS